MEATSEIHERPTLFALFDGLRERHRIQELLDALEFRRALSQCLGLALGGAALFGLWTGLYAMTLPQLVASAIKAPLLLIGTTLICFPSFFVVQYVLSPRALSLREAALLQASTLSVIAVSWVVVALPCSLFLANASNYQGAKVLVTLVAGFGGLIGMGWFARGYRSASSNGLQSGSIRSLIPYMVLFGTVGAQLAWCLRPFLGSASQRFSLFRPLGGNLFESLFF